MAVPPWTRELLNTDTVRQLQAKANELLGELPVTAARGLDRVMRETRRNADQLRRWARRRTSLSTEVINGSGVYFHPSLAGAPLSAHQIDAMVPIEGSFTATSGAARERILGRLRSLVQQQSGHDALVACSFSAAITAAAAAAGQGSVIAIPRGAAMRIDDGPTLPDLLGAAGARVLEIGSPDRCDREDWSSACRAAPNGMIACGVHWPTAAERAQASGLASCPTDGREIRTVQVVPLGSLHTTPNLPADAVTRIDRHAVAQHWLTIVPGDRYLGGPTSALILGSEAALDAVRSTTLWPVLRADLGTVAGLITGIESFESEDRPGLVLRSLLETSVENLQSRCERLATQLAGESSVAACQVTSAPVRISRELSTTIESRQLRITPAGGGGERWVQRLSQDSPSILVSPDGEAILLDLRWVPAQIDGHLVSWLTGGEPPQPAPE